MTFVCNIQYFLLSTLCCITFVLSIFLSSSPFYAKQFSRVFSPSLTSIHNLEGFLFLLPSLSLSRRRPAEPRRRIEANFASGAFFIPKRETFSLSRPTFIFQAGADGINRKIHSPPLLRGNTVIYQLGLCYALLCCTTWIS